MKPPSSPASPEAVSSSSRCWARALLIVFALLSLAPICMHYRFVDHRLEVTRYPWGLMPVHFLLLRSLATLSGWLCLGIVAAFGWSFRRTASVPRLLSLSAATAMLYLTAYLCYALFIVAVLLATASEQT